jgi:hypothetical protein
MSGVIEGLKVLGPILVAIGVFATQPVDKVTVDELEMEKGASVETGAIFAELFWRIFGEWETFCPKRCYQGAACFDVELNIGTPSSAGVVAGPSIGWVKEFPDVMQHAESCWGVVGSTAILGWDSKSPSSTSVGAPWLGKTQRGTD